MSETARIADQLQRSQQGSAWHGPALEELLKDIDAQRAQRRPIAGAHNIWELLLHITAWQTATAGAVQGNIMPMLDGPADWPAAGGSEAEWREAVQRLEKSNQELVAAVAAFPDQRLEDQVPGREYSFYFLLHGLTQHNLYHAGQVALLKKLAE
jgi:hypothetical protein